MCIVAVFLALGTLTLRLAAQEAMSPWAVYLACQGLASGAATLDTLNAEYQKARAFCSLSGPRIGARFGRTERQTWRNALANPPSITTMGSLREMGERYLYSRLGAVQAVAIGDATIAFDERQSTLRDGSRRTLDGILPSLKAALDTDSMRIIDVIGYADSPESSGDTANLRLARDRANAIVAYLVTRGIPADRLLAHGQLVRVPRGSPHAPLARRADIIGSPAGGSLQRTDRAATGRPLSTADFLVGTTDFLLEKAREQVETFLLQEGSRQICRDSAWTRYLAATCMVIPQDVPRPSRDRWSRMSDHERREYQRRRQVYVPGIEAIRAAIRSDLRELPFRLGRAHLIQFANNGSKGIEQRETALYSATLLEALRQVSAGTPPLEAFGAAGRTPGAAFAAGSAPERAVGPAEGVAGHAGSSGAPLSSGVVHLHRVQALHRQVASARADLGAYWNGPVLLDSVALYVVKALVLSQGRNPETGAPDFPAYEGEWVVHVETLLAGARDAQRMALAVEEGWRELRAVPHDSASRARRTALMAQVLTDAAELGLGVLAAEDSGVRARIPAIRGAAGSAIEIVTHLRTEDYSGAITAMMNLVVQATPGERLESTELRLLGFTNDMVQAREVRDVRSAFGRLVGDGPGYLAKRSAGHTYWRLNAYVGLAAGAETLTDAPDAVAAHGGTFGLTVPIGIEFGRGTEGRASNGFFLQLIDLGAIASARINSRGLETFPEFQFGSVVALGLFYTHGFPNAPVSLAVGASHIPQARVDRSGEAIGGIRLGVFGAVDIPLFP